MLCPALHTISFQKRGKKLRWKQIEITMLSIYFLGGFSLLNVPLTCSLAFLTIHPIFQGFPWFGAIYHLSQILFSSTEAFNLYCLYSLYTFQIFSNLVWTQFLLSPILASCPTSFMTIGGLIILIAQCPPTNQEESWSIQSNPTPSKFIFHLFLFGSS